MPVTVHHDRSACQTLQSANEPVSVDQGRTDTFGERLRRPGIFDEMVVESDDPVGSRVFRSNDLDPPDLLSGNHPECVREREMSIGVGVQQDDPEAVVPTWRKYHRKDLGPQLRQRLGQARPSGIGERGHLSEIRLHYFCETLAQTASCKIHDTDTLALERTHGGQGSYLAQPPVRACREVKSRRIAPVNNIKIVVAR